MRFAPLAVLCVLLPALSGAAAPAPDAFWLQNGRYTCRTCAPPFTVSADGRDQPVANRTAYDTVNVAIIDERTVLKIAKRKGKTVIMDTLSVSADGNTATDEVTDSRGAAPVVTRVLLRRVLAGPPGSHAISGSWRTQKILAGRGGPAEL